MEQLRDSRNNVIESIVEERLDRLYNFYEEALSRVGWDRYREINIEFKSQVVGR